VTPPDNWRDLLSSIIQRCWKPAENYCNENDLEQLQSCFEGMKPELIPPLLSYVMPLCPKAKTLIEDAVAHKPAWMDILGKYQKMVDGEVDMFSKFKSENK
jgi:hypothetical protein